mgnify:CR=1 FL=1
MCHEGKSPLKVGDGSDPVRHVTRGSKIRPACYSNLKCYRSLVRSEQSNFEICKENLGEMVSWVKGATCGADYLNSSQAFVRVWETLETPTSAVLFQ